MKTVLTLLVALLVISLPSCQKHETNVLPDYQTAINAKYNALGWTLKADNGGDPQPTTSKKGWVQYYGNKDRAIYYFPVDGAYTGGAFGMLNYEMMKYDKLGQDAFAYVASDPREIRVTIGTVHYNDIIHTADKAPGVLITNLSGGTFVVYGAIYQEYVRLKTWNGPLGYPTTDELDTDKAGGRFNSFSSKGAAIVYSNATGAHGYWNRVDDLYKLAGYSSKWLGFPTTSCDPALGDNYQRINFQGGSIVFSGNINCGSFYNTTGQHVYESGAIQVLNPDPKVITGYSCF